jgi:hypothetical protein
MVAYAYAAQYSSEVDLRNINQVPEVDWAVSRPDIADATVAPA